MALGDEAGQERTEQPTARRREEARARGQVARSADLSGAVLLLGALGMYALSGTALFTGLVGAFQANLSSLPARDLTASEAVSLLGRSAALWAPLLAPFVLVPAAASIVAQLLQTRFALAPRGLAPDWSRLSPMRNLSRLVGLAGLVELVKATLKLAAIGVVAWLVVRQHWPLLLDGGPGSLGGSLGVLGRALGDVWLGIVLAYLAIALGDYGFQWWRHEQSLRMTPQELREETKQTEGNPLLRGRLRALHRQLATRRMLADVKRADVVVRNPTHYAIAR